MNSRLTSLAGDLKGTLIQLLARSETLSAKEAYHLTLKQGLDVSYQAVHKMLSEMHSDGIMLKENGNYALSKAWLSEFSREIDRLSLCNQQFQIYSNKSTRLSSAFRALSLFKQMLFDHHLSLSKDEFYIDGNRMVMVPLKVYCDWYLKMKKTWKDDFLYYSCRNLGAYWFVQLRKQRITHGNVEEEIRLGIDTLNLAGWGSINIDYFDQATRTVSATLDHSSFAAEYLNLRGRSKKPIDDWVCGAVCGALSVIVNEPTLQGVETKCIACGDPACVFEFKPRRLFARKFA